MRTLFGITVAIIAGGLAYMIIIGLLSR